MKKHLLIILTALLVGCGQPKQTLRVFIFPESIDPKIVADFENKFDCKVSLDFYTENETMMAKLSAGGTGLYDIVMPSNYVMPAMVGRGLLSPLRHENIPNLRNLDPQFADQPWDLGNRYSVPYQWGTIGLFIRKPLDKPLDESWDLIFDPKKQPGPFLLIEDFRACIDIAMHYKGYTPNSTNPEELAAARDLLLEVKNRSLGFATVSAARNRVLSKDAVMAIGYSGDFVRGTKEDPGTHYFVPREGANYFVDNLSIPARAPHRHLAEKFINYILDAKVGAQLSEFTFGGTPNKAALEFINATDRNNPAIYPPPEVMHRLWTSRDLGEKNKLYDELWTQIKAK